jgi:carbonic anhydrase
MEDSVFLRSPRLDSAARVMRDADARFPMPDVCTEVRRGDLFFLREVARLFLGALQELWSFAVVARCVNRGVICGSLSVLQGLR